MTQQLKYTETLPNPLGVFLSAFIDACSTIMSKTVCNHYCNFIVKKGIPSLSSVRISGRVQMRWREKVAVSEYVKVSERRTTVSAGSPHHQETDWENVSLSLTAGEGERST